MSFLAFSSSCSAYWSLFTRSLWAAVACCWLSWAACQGCLELLNLFRCFLLPLVGCFELILNFHFQLVYATLSTSAPLEGGWCACRSVSAGLWMHSLGSWWSWLAPRGCCSGLNLVSGIFSGLGLLLKIITVQMSWGWGCLSCLSAKCSHLPHGRWGLQSAACWHAGEKRDWHRSVLSKSLCVVGVVSVIVNH